MGDVAMTVPVVWAVAQQYPDVRITVLSRPYARPLFEGLAPNIHFMEADLKRDYHGIKGLNSLYRRLTAKQFTHVADLHAVLRSAYLRTRFNLGMYRVEHINKERRERNRLVQQKNKEKRQLKPVFEKYADVFERLGFPIAENRFHSMMPPEGGDLALLPDAIGRKQPGDVWIGIAPFAAHQGKIYPKEQMEQVMQQLVERYPKCRLFLFGRGPEEDETFPVWARKMPQCTVVGWHLDNIRQELILMSHLDVMVSMDSANMHLASLTATPVVSVWGATHPFAGFMGWHQSEDNCVQADDLECRPCSIFGQKPCQYGDYRCMAAVTPGMIVNKISHIINPKQT